MYASPRFGMLNMELGELLLQVLPQLAIIFLVFPVLQYFTCRVACYLGDDSPEMLARQTLNPLAHVDLFGGLALLICKVGWPKPLPINPANFYKVKDRRTGMMLVAFAGPLGNLIFAFLFVFLASLFLQFEFIWSSALGGFAISLFQLIAQLSISISLFCCLPLPGLPGEGIGDYFFPEAMAKMRMHQSFITLGIIVVFFLAPQMLAPIIALAQLILFAFKSFSIMLISLFVHLISFITRFWR